MSARDPGEPSATLRHGPSYVLQVTLHGGEGRTTIQHYFVDEARLPVSVQMWTLQPGASEGMHTHHDPPLEELYVVIDGTATLTLDSEVHELGPGDALLSAPGTDHALRNLTDEAVRVMVVWGEPGSADLSGFRTVQRAKALRAEQAG